MEDLQPSTFDDTDFNALMGETLGQSGDDGSSANDVPFDGFNVATFQNLPAEGVFLPDWNELSTGIEEYELSTNLTPYIEPVTNLSTNDVPFHVFNATNFPTLASEGIFLPDENNTSTGVEEYELSNDLTPYAEPGNASVPTIDVPFDVFDPAGFPILPSEGVFLPNWNNIDTGIESYDFTADVAPYNLGDIFSGVVNASDYAANDVFDLDTSNGSSGTELANIAGPSNHTHWNNKLQLETTDTLPDLVPDGTPCNPVQRNLAPLMDVPEHDTASNDTPRSGKRKLGPTRVLKKRLASKSPVSVPYARYPGQTCFTTSGEAPTFRKPRSCFSAEQKDRLKEVRKLSACLRCHYLKRPCSGGDPCDRCANVANAANSRAQSKVLTWMDCIRPSIDALDIFNTAYSTREKAQFQAIVDHLTDFKYLLGLSKRSDIPTIDATARELAGLWTKSSLLTGEVYWLSPEVHVVIMRVVGVELTKLAKLFIDLSFIETDSFVEREKNVNKHEKFERVGNWVGTQLLEALESRLKVDKLAKSDKPQLQGLFLLVYLTLYGLTYKLGSNYAYVGTTQNGFSALKRAALQRLLRHYLVKIGTSISLFSSSDEQNLLDRPLDFVERNEAIQIHEDARIFDYDYYSLSMLVKGHAYGGRFKEGE